MMRTLITWAARAAVLAVAGLAAAAVPAGAGASPPADLGDNPPHAVVSSYDCEVRLVLDNSGPYTDGIGHDGPWFVEFDWRLPGDVQLELEPGLDGLTISDPPLAGQPFDGLHNPVPVEAGQTATVDITAEPGTAAIEVRLVRGAEQRVWFDWRAYPINCPPAPTPTPTVSPTTGPSPSPSSPAPSASTSPSPAPGAGQGGSDDELPLTGSPTTVLAGAGLGLAGAGVAAVLTGRRRRALSAR